MADDPDWTPDPEDPEDSLSLAKESPRAPEPAQLAHSRFPDQLSSKTFFYPACGDDWQPLHRFTHLCDTFIYCDNCDAHEYFGDLKALIERDIPQGVELRVESVEELENERLTLLAEPMPIKMGFDMPRVERPWGKKVKLVRKVGQIQRKITLYYLRAEGVTLYANLFGRQCRAPRVICVKGMESNNWTTFRLWHGWLGRVVWDNPAKPQIIVADNDEPKYDWPWTKVWQHHIGWDEENYGGITSYVLPSSLPVPVGWRDSWSNHVEWADSHIRVRRRGMQVLGDVEPWLTHLEQSRRRLIVLEKLRMNNHARGNPLPIPTAEPNLRLWEESASLSAALQKLSQIVQNGTERVVWSGGIRFEDEGAALTELKNREFPHFLRLTLQCRTEGDLYSFGPYADAVFEKD